MFELLRSRRLTIIASRRRELKVPRMSDILSGISPDAELHRGEAEGRSGALSPSLVNQATMIATSALEELQYATATGALVSVHLDILANSAVSPSSLSPAVVELLHSSSSLSFATISVVPAPGIPPKFQALQFSRTLAVIRRAGHRWQLRSARLGRLCSFDPYF